MCGVFGFVGQPTNVVPIVANALRIMEYRGYDSWGIGWDSGNHVSLLKQTGRVPATIEAEHTASIAIGHTRWATHGPVTHANAHPHTDASGQIAVVHNGVIENALALKSQCLGEIPFRSETDSELVPHLIRKFMDGGQTFTESVRSTFLMLEGSSAILAIDRSSQMMIAVTARSPLRLGRRNDGWELASDPLACAGSSQEIAVVPDNHLVILTANTSQIVDVVGGSEIAIPWEPTPEEMFTSRGDFPHFTIKEIHDQVEILNSLGPLSRDVAPLAAVIRNHSHIVLTGCGSALYAATLGAGWLAQATSSWVDVVPASEINERTRNQGGGTLVIALSQSGETADVIDALQHAKNWGSEIAAIVNTESSTIANMVGTAVGIQAGVERSVLATKSFMGMAVRLFQTASLLKDRPGVDWSHVSSAISDALANDQIARIAQNMAAYSSLIVLGNGFGRAVAQEAALKIKEGSYIHAEAFLTSELKHGPLALVEEGTPCLIIATTPDELRSARIAAAEVSARGGNVVLIGDLTGLDSIEVIRVDSSSPLASLVHLAIVQKLAYHIAIARGVDPDFPRNLAKSVTVR